MTIPEHPGPSDDDPNEAYDVVPMPEKPYGPSGWWTVICNGIPVRHFGPDKKELAQRYATDAEYRASLVTEKLWKSGMKKT
jgi:hypothetical protein